MNCRQLLLITIIGSAIFLLISCGNKNDELSNYDEKYVEWQRKSAECNHEWINLHHITEGIMGYGYDFKCKKCGNIVHSSKENYPAKTDKPCYDCRPER